MAETMLLVGGRVNPLTTEHRPWGSWTVLEEGLGYKIKRLEVTPGKRMSLQMHFHRSEHWVVVSGTARVVVGDRTTLVHTQESTFVASGTVHRIENPGLIPLVIIEIQNGQYLGEDDIVRLEDDYGRVPRGVETGTAPHGATSLANRDGPATDHNDAVLQEG